MRTFSRDSFSPSAGHAAATADRRRGSALLIVLGFLSFMIISAVSFAIYMRIERQASSNYRHSVTARHLLNAGLFRAIDEVDSELRLRQSGVVKFPREVDWPGRVKVSALATQDKKVQTSQDAHVLSIESLSYLPAFLINDVRRYAVRDEDDDEWKGAKWRTLERSTDNDIVGRYAYVCVNLSDMLDVNLCKANQARDSFTGRVNLGHLFGSDGKRDQFDDDFTKALHYFSLQDFYAVRYDRNPAADSSPYHDYLENGRLTVFNNAANLKHVFTTDSIVKPEPTNGTACNILLNPPFNATLLANPRPAPGQLVFDAVGGKKPFWEALKASPRNTTLGNMQEQMMAAMLKDYLDSDPLPSNLSLPCVEMVPMISQIVIDKNRLQPEVFEKTIPAAKAGDPDIKQYGVRLINQAIVTAGIVPMSVEVIWPFKYFNKRNLTSEYKVRGLWCFTIVKSSQNTHSKELQSFSFQLTSQDSAPLRPAMFSENAISTDANACYRQIQLHFAPPSANENEVLLVNENGTDISGSPFKATDNIRVACTMRLQILTTYQGGERVVDEVPCMVPDPSVDSTMLWKSATPKLYFQTDPVLVSSLPAKNGAKLEYSGWNSLEIPDPRFNYKAVNWISGIVESGQVDAKMNESTVDVLKDGTGRDRDLFMSVSDTGYMQSPGELGFIIRPFTHNVQGSALDFDDQKKAEEIPDSNPDKNAMFRTFRLYDHGGTGPDQLRDNVYGHFYAMKADGTLPGARVNPLSDIPEVLEAALWGTPLDYWIAATNNSLPVAVRKELTFNNSPSHFNFNDSPDKWKIFLDFDKKNGGWYPALDKVTPEVNKEWKNTLSDFYGEWANFKWYSDDLERKKIFDGFSLDNPLHEVDRKMLYSFSLDSFSDRQQLFLYILRAEATVPSFGGGADSGMRSLAGGRAVALVWRDPYPRGYDRLNDIWDLPNNAKTDPTDLARRKDNGWYPNNTNYESPWKQYHPGQMTERWNGYHDTRVLFFKQLDK